MPVNNPDRAFFWDETNKSWRAAQVGEAGEYVWNNTTKSWEFGTDPAYCQRICLSVGSVPRDFA